MTPESLPTAAAPLFSDFEDDPDMRELVKMFVGEMPARAGLLERHWAEGDLPTLRRMAHQLRGAGGGYGFAPVSEAAGRLEELLRQDGQPTEDALRSIQREVEGLIDVCRRVSARAE